MNQNLRKKRHIAAFLIYSLLLFLYTILFFAIPFSKNSVSWISFFFTEASILISFLIYLYAFQSCQNVQETVYAYPVFRIGGLYLIVQLISGTIFCVIDVYFNIPAWVAVAFFLIILSVALAACFITGNIRVFIQDTDRKTREETVHFKSLYAELTEILELCQDDVLKRELRFLEERFRFSDPVTTGKMSSIEKQLASGIQELRELVLSEDYDTALKKIRSLSAQLRLRNRICKDEKE